jgi:hypothetical protein
MKISPRYVARLLAATADDAVDALAQLSSFWSARARLTETGELTGLSPSELAAHLALWYCGEVGNGGHTQYFVNPVGSFAHETITSLEKLGLDQAASILWNAVQVFPDQRVPREQAIRLARINALCNDHLDLLHRLDLALWAISGRIDLTILRYLEAHRDDVLAAELERDDDLT